MLPNGSGYLAALVLAGAFVVAAAGKLVRPGATASAFTAFGIPQPHAVARLVPATELIVAVLLVAVPRPGGVVALALLGAFSAVLLRAVRAGITTPCRCFGAVREQPVSAVDLFRNAMLAALAVAAVAAGTPRPPSVAALLLVAAVVAAGAAALRLARGPG
jgi:hypothetical protein